MKPRGRDAPAPGDAAPAVTLPKGGGAIRGMGEAFTALPATGTASMTVPIALSPGRGGIGPDLSLSYDSAAGNGPFGFGWSLSLPAITRKTEKGLPRYQDAEEEDVFVLTGAEDLVPALQPDGTRHRDEASVPGWRIERYLPRIEAAFQRIERWTRLADGDVQWRTISAGNVLTVYGRDAGSRIRDPAAPARIFAWLIAELRDDRGNAALYEYRAENGEGADLSLASERQRGLAGDARRAANRHLKRVLYGNRVPLLDAAGQRPRFLTDAERAGADWMFEAVLDYGEHDRDAPRPDDAGAWHHRRDAFSVHRAGFEVRTARLCRRVLMFHHFPGEPGVGAGCLVRATEFTHAEGPAPSDPEAPVYSFLTAVTQAGFRRRGAGYLRRAMPPAEFTYSQPRLHDRIEALDRDSLAGLPAGLDPARHRWLDLRGEGLPGLLTEEGGAWHYKRNLSPLAGGTARLGPPEIVAALPNARLAEGARFADLAGDGLPDLVLAEGNTPGFHESDGAGGWLPFRPFTRQPVRDLDDPNLRFVDLDGDGRADILVTEEDVLVWHRAEGEAGYAPAECIGLPRDEAEGPRLVFADTDGTLFLADMSGDGLADLVRIRRREICYWPSLGHGRFGPRVVMDDAPELDSADGFDPARIRLADVDGSGTTDLIYLRGDGVRLHLNRSGNGWGPPRLLPLFPRPDDIATIDVADLLGTGTACLVWSSPLPEEAQRPLRYMDLMGGEKPHLLQRVVNNLGAETRIGYAPSTRFMLEDERAGRPWITRLPFPVHVVARVETLDHVGRSRFVTRYAYHHGHFDGEEREFRGFGMVERWDTEDFAALTADGTLPAENIDAASHVPPVLTRSWYHTGIFMGGGHVSDHFAGLLGDATRGEYFREPGRDAAAVRALLLPDTVLPPGLTAEEQREAVRALKGTLLREEVYALDGSARAAVPYTATERNVGLRLIQPRGSNRHAVFLVHPREELAFHYERDPSDPRIAHELTLEVNGFGQALRSLSIGYGRRAVVIRPDAQGRPAPVPNPALAALAPEDRARQARSAIVTVENRQTNAVDITAATHDAWRIPALHETITQELTGFAPQGGAERFALEWLREGGFARIDGAAPLGPAATPDHVTPQRRLVGHERVFYRRDDLSGALPPGTIEPLGLVLDTHRLALTDDLIAAAHGAAVTPAMLAGEGFYLGTDGGTRWWASSGRVFFSANPADPPATELAEARAHFFMPRRIRDPFGAETIISYDHDLMVRDSVDALGNRTTAGGRLATGAPDPAEPGNDFRVLAPRLVTDPNGARAEFAHDAYGLLAGVALAGPPGAPTGDSLASFEPDPTEADLLAFLADPAAEAPRLLGRATSRFLHDMGAVLRSRGAPALDPASVASLARERFSAELAPGATPAIRIGLAYSDGFGRSIQSRNQAEPAAPGGPPRWVASGWVVHNNKGDPVRQYEPFFSPTHRFEFGTRIGVSAVLFYDPLGRVVARIEPDESHAKTVFDPWRTASWDANDTALSDPRADPDIAGVTAGFFAARAADPAAVPWRGWHAARAGGALGPAEADAAAKAAAHAATPLVAHLDTLGRVFLSVAHNRTTCPGHDRDGTEEFAETRTTQDIAGNLVEERDAVVQAGDARGRIVARHRYDLLGNRIRTESMDAGERRVLPDIAGQTVRSWDARGHAFRVEYDVLRRPLRHFVAGTIAADPAREILSSRLVYGEQHPEAEQRHLRGRLHLQLDQAGLVATEWMDFRGHPLETTRRLTLDWRGAVDWSAVEAALPAASARFDPATLAAALAPLAEAEIFRTTASYDALERPVLVTTPHSATMRPNLLRPTYNPAGAIERIAVNLQDRQAGGQPVWTEFVTGVDYDAKGRRTRVTYGNGVLELHDYDPLTFRLARSRVLRDGGAFPGDCPVPAPAGWPGCALQDRRLSYDAAGNITRVTDAAQQAIFFRNRRVEPGADYTLDALYRLVSATGREHLGQAGQALPHAPDDAGRSAIESRQGARFAPADGGAMDTYVERYVYDLAGNLLAMQHRGSIPARFWTRSYSYAEPSATEPTKRSNRLSATSLGGAAAVAAAHRHDAHGNMLRLPHLAGADPQANLHWDHADRLVRADLGGGGTVHFTYDAQGERVRKVWVKSPTLVEERIYLGGVELHRRRQGAARLERETLHVMDGSARVAVVETRTLDTAGTDQTPAELRRYQFADSLGSAMVELDDAAQIITFEEYAPFGATTFQAVRSQTETPKRYRFTGKERDAETGLAYHGARYYAPWLGRWASADPAEQADGPNRYAYVRGQPHQLHDPAGLAGKKGGKGKQVDWDAERGKHTQRKAAEMDKAAKDAKAAGKTPDPMQAKAEAHKKNVSKTGRSPIEQHHHAGVEQAKELGAHPDKVGKPSRMSSLWSRRRYEDTLGAVGDKPVWDPKVNPDTVKTHHNVGAYLDKEAQKSFPKTAKGLEDAADFSKWQMPATADMTERAKMDWTRSVPKGPPVNPHTGAVIAEKGLKSGRLAAAGAKLAKGGRHFVAAIPIAGMIMGHASAAHAASEGDLAGAALDEAGHIPVAGDLLDAGRGGMAVGEAMTIALPSIERNAMATGEQAEAAAKWFGADEDMARNVGAAGAALGAVADGAAYLNPMTLPFKLAAEFW